MSVRGFLLPVISHRAHRPPKHMASFMIFSTNFAFRFGNMQISWITRKFTIMYTHNFSLTMSLVYLYYICFVTNPAFTISSDNGTFSMTTFLLNVVWFLGKFINIPDSKVHGANKGPTCVLSAPDGPHVGPMNLAIRDTIETYHLAP